MIVFSHNGRLQLAVTERERGDLLQGFTLGIVDIETGLG